MVNIMIYYNLDFIMYILLAIFIYMIIFNVYIILVVKRFRNHSYFKATNIPSVYSNLVLALNYIVLGILVFFLLKDYVFNHNFVLTDFYNMWGMVSIIIYVNLFSMIVYAYQKTVYISLSNNELEKSHIFWDKKVTLFQHTNLKVWINNYKVCSGKTKIVFDRLKYDDSIEVVIKEIENTAGSRFFK